MHFCNQNIASRIYACPLLTHLVRLTGVISIVFWRMIATYPGFTRHLLTRVGAWQSSSSAGALTPYIYSSPLFSPPPQRGTGWCTSISTPSPSLPAISTTMFTMSTLTKEMTLKSGLVTLLLLGACLSTSQLDPRREENLTNPL